MVRIAQQSRAGRLPERLPQAGRGQPARRRAGPQVRPAQPARHGRSIRRGPPDRRGLHQRRARRDAHRRTAAARRVRVGDAAHVRVRADRGHHARHREPAPQNPERERDPGHLIRYLAVQRQQLRVHVQLRRDGVSRGGDPGPGQRGDVRGDGDGHPGSGLPGGPRRVPVQGRLMTAGQAVGVGGGICPAQYIEGGGGGGAVASVFGRTGTVVAATGDYTYTQVGADQAGAAAAVLATVVAAYAPLASPALTGTPTAPTAAPGDTSGQLATDAFVAAAVSAAVQGLAVKPSVQEATTTALPANTYSNGASGVGATLTAVLPGVLTVDGVAVTLGSRVLVQDEVAAANNGIYVMTTLGTVSVAYVLTRAADMNQAAEVPGAFVFTEQGTVNAGAWFTVSGAGPYTIGTTAINWTQFSGAGEIQAGSGLTKTGNTLSVNVVSGQNLCTPTQYAPASQTVFSTTSATLSAVSSSNVNTGSFTAPASGSVVVTATLLASVSAIVNFSFALAAHGSVTPVIRNVITTAFANTNARGPLDLLFLVTGLTPGTSYNFDLLFAMAGADTLSIYALGSTSTVPTGTVGAPVIMTVQAV